MQQPEALPIGRRLLQVLLVPRASGCRTGRISEVLAIAVPRWRGYIVVRLKRPEQGSPRIGVPDLPVKFSFSISPRCCPEHGLLGIPHGCILLYSVKVNVVVAWDSINSIARAQ